MSQPFIYTWEDFVHQAMLEVKNGWPLLSTDIIRFLDEEGNDMPILPTYVQITLNKKVQTHGN